VSLPVFTCLFATACGTSTPKLSGALSTLPRKTPGPLMLFASVPSGFSYPFPPALFYNPAPFFSSPGGRPVFSRVDPPVPTTFTLFQFSVPAKLVVFLKRFCSWAPFRHAGPVAPPRHPVPRGIFWASGGETNEYPGAKGHLTWKYSPVFSGPCAPPLPRYLCFRLSMSRPTWASKLS